MTRRQCRTQYSYDRGIFYSGMSDSQWCLQHGIRPGTFYNWVNRIKKKGGIHIPSSGCILWLLTAGYVEQNVPIAELNGRIAEKIDRGNKYLSHWAPNGNKYLSHTVETLPGKRIWRCERFAFLLVREPLHSCE